MVLSIRVTRAAVAGAVHIVNQLPVPQIIRLTKILCKSTHLLLAALAIGQMLF
jgi:hypothetical protein